MGSTLNFDYSNALDFIPDASMAGIEQKLETAANILNDGTGAGNDFLGWLDWPEQYDKEEFKRIQAAAKKIRSDSELLIVIGIGGSYLGAKAAISFLSHHFYNELPKDKRDGPEIYFAGINLSPSYLTDLIELIGDRDFSVLMISKSGTTTEPAISFRIIKKLLEDKYGERAAMRIFATTDKSKGALKQLADAKSYQSFIVPDNIGGRFSVLTAVGLLPIAVAGIDIIALMEGAKAARTESQAPFDSNSCYQYAAIRNQLYSNDRKVEILVSYEPRFQYLAEWWKQLYGESEGKNGLGIFPASAQFTADLHSLGQYIQDGERHIFETCITIDKFEKDITMTADAQNLDGLNYLSGKTLSYINSMAEKGTMQAHIDGSVPYLKINLNEANAFSLGYLFYWFEKACALSGYVLGVNPFDQPGVEMYKRNMFKLLNKPGYES